MERTISLISDLLIILFDITLYIRLTQFKRWDWTTFLSLGIGCTAIISAYFVATYVYHVPYSIASFLFMTLPSIILFFILSKFKNARFIVTFCFVDTFTLVLAAISKVAVLAGGMDGAIISLYILIFLCSSTLLIMWPYCDRYRELLENVSKGYNAMAVCCVLIYALLIFAAAYPTPLITRSNDIPTYLFFCLTLLSFYVVFIILIKEKANLVRANKALKLQQHWKELAYIDELTKIGNKTAYDSKIDELINIKPSDENYGLILFDLDSLKYVNDNFGHLAGDEALKNAVSIIQSLLDPEKYYLFRIGGDEFIALSHNVEEKEIKNIVNDVNKRKPHNKYKYSCSCGYALIDFNKDNPFEDALKIADKRMYEVKNKKRKCISKKKK